uniref:Uncharacterized protein n=1 Tax=Myotis myotis TaxID=51298 RepID=A0A7J7RDZ6_MYOMY|nr:hypothetical protein mMyoMyo1_010376 [Myotis myotis]
MGMKRSVGFPSGLGICLHPQLSGHFISSQCVVPAHSLSGQEHWTLDLCFCYFLILTKDIFPLIFFREGKTEKHQCERNIDWLPLARPGPGRSLQPRYVPLNGIEPGTLWSAGQLYPLRRTGSGWI